VADTDPNKYSGPVTALPTSNINLLTAIADFVWGPALMLLIVGTGVYLSIGLRGISISRIPEAFRLLLSPEARGRAQGAGEISPFAALMSALSATVGVGNIAGVATAIHLGGPGALFWMWMTALVGMGTKYAETFLAVSFREKVDGHFLGGPMYYIKLGLGPQWAWLGGCFAVFASVAALGVGASVQANAMSNVLDTQFGVPPWSSGIILGLATFAVLVGGLKRIASVSEFLVPSMIFLFMGAGVLVLAINIAALPQAIGLIFTSAFTGTAATGGFVGSSVALAMRYGISRGLFSNEAGLGSAAILHAAARSDDAVKQGAIGMLGTFIDTLVVNSVTGLAIVSTGVWMSGATAAPLTAMAYESTLPGLGGTIVSVSLILFAFTTILSWSVYGERCAAFLVGVRVILPYRYAWCLAAGLGAIIHLDVAWLIADITNALMALPNLVALLLMSPLIFRLTRERLAGGRTLKSPMGPPIMPSLNTGDIT
jgi:AGCS family alanine or glycine:cation symporter